MKAQCAVVGFQLIFMAHCQQNPDMAMETQYVYVYATALLHLWQLSALFCSTIEGRIDQMNQVLILDKRVTDTCRYNALDKWSAQLQGLAVTVASKLS